jgi:hypothetical protein
MTTRERLEVMLGRCVEAGSSDDAEALREVLAYWYERRPAPAGQRRCVVCGEPFAGRPVPGRKPLYCGSACRNRAFRERNGKGAAGGQTQEG